MHPVRLTLAGLMLAVLLGFAGRVQAQSEGDVWGAPVNLSRSGAAAQPRVVATADGRLQVFWWDRFDGLMTVLFGGTTWSRPMMAPILSTLEIENPRPDQEPTVTAPAVSDMPLIVSDGTGWVHALWLGVPDQETEAQALFHSQMPIGTTSWSEPEAVAESAVAFEVTQTPSGALTLAYVRELHTDAEPAGVYVRRHPGGGSTWGAASVVHDTIYFRLSTPEQAYVRVADGGDRTLHVVWEDPRLGEALYARSVDGGSTWTEPLPLGDFDQRPARPRVVTLPHGSTLRLWEASALSGCALYQQRLTNADAPLDTWSAPELVLQGTSRCPEAERFWLRDDGLFWVWGEGSRALTLAAWDAAQERWSEPRVFDFGFEDPETGRPVSLQDLHVALAPRSLAIVGYDPASGEVWATRAAVNVLELAFAPPPPWSAPVRLSRVNAEAGRAAVALDPEGGVHVAWGEGGADGGPGTALLYAHHGASTERWSGAVEVAGGASAQELTRQPALVVDGRGLLHLVWSGGRHGQILYSRARVGQAASAGEWSPPQTLSDPAMTGSWPQIGVDAAGRLYVVYAVPLNEGRGIYLVHSDDGGLSWSEPEALFDAQAAGWAMVDHPALAVASDGTLHVAWVRAALPATWPPQGIYYARVSAGDIAGGSSSASDLGEARIPTEPRELAGAGHDWPRLALAGGAVHLIYIDAAGSVVHRRYGVSGQAGGGGWNTQQQVAGLTQVSGLVGLAVDGGGMLHLVGVTTGGEALLYTAWDGARWSGADAFALGPEVEAGFGVAAVAPHQGGQLTVVLRVSVADGPEEIVSTLYHVARLIPTLDVSPLPTPPRQPTATPELAAEELTPTASVPTPTPDLTAGPAPSGPAVDPQLLGGGLAALIVIGALVTWPLWGRRR